MDFNKLATLKRQANLSLKAQAYLDNGSARPPKRKNIGDDANDEEGDDTPDRQPKKGRVAQNNGVGPTPASKDSNPRVLTASRLAAASQVSLGDGNIPKTGRASQGDGAVRVGLSRGASNPRIPSASRSTASRASSGSVGDMTSSTEPSVEVEGHNAEMEEVVEVYDSEETPEDRNPKESDEEQLGT